MSDVIDPVFNLAQCVEHIRDEAAHMQVPLEHMPDIIAVTKTHGPEKILPLLEANHHHYGENRVQEAHAKWPALKGQFPDITLHLIGPLQTNKAKEAISLFDVIHTLDREKLARTLANEMQKQNRHLPCFIQVNTGEEEQKAGLSPHDLSSFLPLCHELHLDIKGLMCIPPVNEPAAVHFALLKKLAHENNLHELSIGMSNDYALAATLGACYVRIGSAVFGERGKEPWHD